MSARALPLIGIFVGGASKRMGRTKGLLLEPGGSRTLVDRLLAETQAAFPGAPWFLVGRRPEYDFDAARFLDDAVPESGPLGGLVALTEAAPQCGCTQVLALGCDFPRLGASLLRRLGSEAEHAPVVAPWLDERWQPLVARYDAETAPVLRAALTERRLSLQPLLHSLGCARLQVSEDEKAQLADWDEPSDVDARA